MAWQRGDPWRVVESLQTLLRQVRAAAPDALPPATPVTAWGSIADDAHNSSSDHYPHYYDALGKVAVVCARDFPHAPRLGLDAHAIAEQLRRSRDSRIGYVISNGRITGPNHGWGWDRYTGSDPHDTHIHVSTVHSKLADDARAWQIGDDGMSFLDEKQGAVLNNRTGGQLIGDIWYLLVKGNASTALAKQLAEAKLRDEAILAAVQGVDDEGVKALIESKAAELAAGQSAARDAILAALPEGDGPVSRADLEAALRAVFGSLDGATPGA